MNFLESVPTPTESLPQEESIQEASPVKGIVESAEIGTPPSNAPSAEAKKEEIVTNTEVTEDIIAPQPTEISAPEISAPAPEIVPPAISAPQYDAVPAPAAPPPLPPRVDTVSLKTPVSPRSQTSSFQGQPPSPRGKAIVTASVDVPPPVVPPPPTRSSSPPPPEPDSISSYPVCYAVYDFQGSQGELSFKKDAKIVILEQAPIENAAYVIFLDWYVVVWLLP